MLVVDQGETRDNCDSAFSGIGGRCLLKLTVNFIFADGQFDRIYPLVLPNVPLSTDPVLDGCHLFAQLIVGSGTDFVLYPLDRRECAGYCLGDPALQRGRCIDCQWSFSGRGADTTPVGLANR